MTDDTFLQAILGAPDDDTHRLVYADWLDENGGEEAQARAALIRAQCEAERLPRGKRRWALEREAKDLIKANPQWTTPITDAGLGKKPVFRRGFLHQLILSATDFVVDGRQLFDLAPTIRSIVFLEAANEVEDLSACPLLGRLAEADLSRMCVCGYCPIEEDLAALFDSPFTANMARLSIAGDRMDDEGAQALGTSTAFPGLRELDLSDNHLGNAGARTLLESPWLRRLERLDLRNNGIGVRAANALRKRFGDAVVL
jgi:uncharacterized protein (TIGR02996 family)